MDIASLKRNVVMCVLLLCSMRLIGQVITTHSHFPSDDRYKSLSIDEEMCCYGRDSYTSNIIPLSGKVYRAKPGEKADLLIKIAGEDEVSEMDVGIVKEDPNECGLWQWVSRREDADFSVKFVNSDRYHVLVRIYEDGEWMRTDYGNMKCEDWSTGRPRPCKKRKR
ncbi:MAG: hypothetical protein KBT04_04015 [Bacteroidales bacterium]|nr:hypothetical protein [Candidatus Colimorpha onthohippi]